MRLIGFSVPANRAAAEAASFEEAVLASGAAPDSGAWLASLLGIDGATAIAGGSPSVGTAANTGISTGKIGAKRFITVLLGLILELLDPGLSSVFGAGVLC